MMDDRDAELANVLNCLSDCVREMAIIRWREKMPDEFMTNAEQQARNLLALYQGQFASPDRLAEH